MTIDHHTALEEALFRALNFDGGRVLDALMVTLSARWFGAACAVTLALAIASTTGRRRAPLLLALALALAVSDFVGARALRPLFGRMRPCYALHDTVRWLAPASDVGSLPSLHASNFFAMAGVAWAAGRRVGVPALVIAAAVAASRVYVGVHWPTDVVAGAAWGGACAWGALSAARAVVEARRSRRAPPA